MTKDSCQAFPLISVIIPVYRVEKYLRRCVDSVLCQTYTNLEVILVDDGSPDSCGKICDAYAAGDKRVRVIHKTNQGLSSARNAGLEVARGEYIGFVDSDDYIEPDMYEYLYGLLAKENAPVAMCNVYRNEEFTAQGQITQPYCLIPAFDIFQFNSWRWVWNKLYRKDFISTLRFDTATSYGEDGLFIFELVKMKGVVAVGNQPKYHYCFKQNPNALTQRFQPKHLKRIVLIEQCLQYAKEHNMNIYYKQRVKVPLLNATKWLMQIAFMDSVDTDSVLFLTGYVKKHLRQFLFVGSIHWKQKAFILVSCVNFNLARSILRFYHFKIKKYGKDSR